MTGLRQRPASNRRRPAGGCARLARLARAVLAVVALTATVPAFADEPFTFAQMCDPQFGMGGYERDVVRFRQAVSQINALKPDFVVICGDLVNTATIEGTLQDFAEKKKALEAPCYCAPGNHDVGAGSEELLAQYREVIGKDYYEFEHKGRVFLVVNSQFWVVDWPGESKKHDAWFQEALGRASAAGKPVFVVAHHPLYVERPDEPTDPWNIPFEKRRELLELVESSGVVAWISGHLHKTVINEHEGIQLVSSENTSSSFDGKPFGFRVWRIGETRPYENDFVPLDLSKMDPGKSLDGTVAGLREHEDCVVVILEGRHAPTDGQDWTLEELQRLEPQSRAIERPQDGRFRVDGLPSGPLTVVAVALTPTPEKLNIRCRTLVIDAAGPGLSFDFSDEEEAVKKHEANAP